MEKPELNKKRGAIIQLLLSDDFVGSNLIGKTDLIKALVLELNLQNVVRSLRFDKPTETGWLFDSDLLRNITHKANKHDPLISMEQVEYVLRAIADKQ